MAKFIFEDDDGTNHEIKFSSISTKSLTKNDSIIAYYEVGDANVENTKVALTQLRSLLENVLPEGAKVAVIATRNGKKDVDITVVKNK